jgi:hypothetical protein
MENCIITKQSYNPKTTRSSHKVMIWNWGERGSTLIHFFGDKQDVVKFRDWRATFEASHVKPDATDVPQRYIDLIAVLVHDR